MMFEKFSFFAAPIKPYKDAEGRKVGARLEPTSTTTVEFLATFIRQNRQLRELTDELRALPTVEERREFKATRLPYVTPCGVFSRRRAQSVTGLSGLVVLDVDHLAGLDEARRVRDLVHDDPWLRPALTFVSPGGQGVKALVPYVGTGAHALGCMSVDEFEDHGHQPTRTNLETVAEQIMQGMEYLDFLLMEEGVVRLTKKQVRCDFSGKDVARACFLCHDPEVRLRRPETGAAS